MSGDITLRAGSAEQTRKSREGDLDATGVNIDTSGGAVSVVPDELRPYHLASTREKTRRMHSALTTARKLYREKFGSLIECLQQAAFEGKAAPTPAAWHARQLLKSLHWGGNLEGWSIHATTRRAEIYDLLDKAIRQTRQMRGGWLVSIPGGLR